MIEIRNLSKRYGDSTVIDNVSLNLAEAGVTAIIGPNGAGKSTLLGLISRLQSIDAGTVHIDGLDITTTASMTLARKLAILRQENQISTRLRVIDLVTFGRYPYCKGRPGPEDLEQVQRTLAFLNLQDLAQRFLDTLSGGQRQRAYIAMVLCQDTDYVLLDEPLNNLDMKHAVDIMKLMQRASVEMGKKVIIVLHDINFAAYYADDIVALQGGKLVFQGHPEELITTEKMKALYDIDMTIERFKGRPIGLYYA